MNESDTPTYIREFTIIAFRRREGKLYRAHKEEFKLSVSDSCVGIVTRKASALVAQGLQVIVLEFGSIKPDWSRLDVRGYELLMKMSSAEYGRFAINLNSMSSINVLEFKAHLMRSFPNLERKQISPTILYGNK